MKLRAVVGVVAFVASVAAGAIVGCGADGANGTNGAAGANGAGGDVGAAGAAGAAGQAGPQGEPGTSAGDAGVKAPYNAGLDLKLAITGTVIDGAQVATTTFHLTDANDVPVTLPITTDGRIGTLNGATFTADQVSISFVLSWLDQTGSTPGYYTPYTLRAVDGGTPKASTDSGGKFAVAPGDGNYTYTFATKIAVAAGNGTKTHTVGAYAVRKVPGLATPYVANAEYNFLPAGGAVAVTREVVKRDNCNACHTDLGHHGSNARKDIQLCILCHNPTTTDLPTGNTINFGPMIHKIHRGESLPSVAEKNDAGAPLYPYGIGHDDYSDVAFPQDIGNCTKCHDGAKDSVVWKTASLAACTSCHDRTYFGPSATPPASPASTLWTLHKLGTPIDPNAKAADGRPVCTTCHDPGGLADPAKYHHIKNTTPVVKIISAGFTAAPGSKLQVEFDLDVTDNTVVPAVTTHNDPTVLGTWTNSGASVTIYFGGPSDDFGSIGAPSPSALGAVNGTSTSLTVWSGKGSALGGVTTTNGAGHLLFTSNRADFDTTLTPQGLKGTWEVAMAAAAQAAPVVINSVSVSQPRYYATNDVYYVNAATNAKGTSPKFPVESARCNTCHEQVPGHGGSRNDPRVCKICHTPNRAATPFSFTANPARPGAFAGQLTGSVAVGSALDLKAYIHNLHLGTNRSANNPFFVSGNDYGGIRYPDQLTNCEHCHVPGGNALPLIAPTNIPVVSTLYTCTADNGTNCTAASAPTTVYTGPEKAVCTSCHDTVSATTHATIMSVNPGASAPQSPSNPNGYAESCDTCHGTGRDYDVAKVHSLH